MTTKLRIILSIVGLTMMSSIALAQTPQAPAERSRTPAPSVSSVPSLPSVPSVPSMPSVPAAPAIPNVDPLGDVMFSPELIMRHTRELGLTIQQKANLRDEIQKTTTRFNELQWQLQDAMEVLLQTMEPNVVNDQQALAQLDKVLDVEREIKRLHVGLGIRIKNQLTAEQQAKLLGMRRTPAPHRQPSPPPNE